MKYPDTKQTENAGLNYIRTVVNNCGAIFRSIGESDVGIDGYIEFVDAEEVTGFIVGVQAKSGNSYVDRKKNEYIIKSDIAHFKYWANSIIPIAGIVYDPERGVAGWVDLGQFAREHLVLKKKNYIIRFTWAFQFDENTFTNSFRDAFEPYRVRSELIEILESVSSPDSAKRLLGVLALRQYRTSKVSCFVFSNLLRDPDIDIRRIAVIWFSTYFPHPDIWWTDEFKPATGDLREYASFLAKGFDRGIIQSMLEAIDEEGLDRGSVGQCVWVIIVEIPAFKAHLTAIASDHSIPDLIRLPCICLIGELGLVENRALLEDLKESTNDPDLLEAIDWTLEGFEE